MAAVEMRVDLSTLINAIVSGHTTDIVQVAREYLQHNQNLDVLIGRIGLIAAQRDSDGHTVTTLAAAAMLARLIHTIPDPLDRTVSFQERALPLFLQTLLFAAPAIQAGHALKPTLPEPLYPSGLSEGHTVNTEMHDAIFGDNPLLIERLLLGLYGTGADYRSLQIRTYDGIAPTFQQNGHPLILAVRGFQLLDAVEWGNRVPTLIHWLAPRLSMSPTAEEPSWVHALRDFLADTANSVASVRTRLAPPKDENALPLRELILSDAETPRVCQGVRDALLQGGASARAIASVLTLAAANILQRVNDDNRELFLHVAHGLLFSTSTRIALQQVQDIEVLQLLFTAASYLNALHKEVAVQQGSPHAVPPTASSVVGGGLIAASQLEALHAQLVAQDVEGAFTTTHRYLTLHHDPRALFATIGLIAAHNDARADQGHTLQIVQATSEAFLMWPGSLASTSLDAFFHIALRAAAFGTRDTVVSQL